MARLQRIWRENWLTLIVLAVLAAGYLVLRTPASAVESLDDVTARLGQGRPLVVYFFSNT